MKARYLVSCAVAALLSGSAAAAAAGEMSTAANASTATAVTTNAGADASAPVAASDTSALAQAVVNSADAAAVPVGEVVVTAQRRNESIQKVPMTVQALTAETLSEFGITTVDDIIKFTPNVTFGNNGPGQGNIFMRGLSSGFAGNQSSATIAPFPNVALYLDDQSMQFPSRNVDVYVVDMQRIEVLEGPQGTLFGGGAEAGAIRYITNKPDLHKESISGSASYGGTSGGADNSSFNLVVNVPIIDDKFAIRGVIYDDRHGGYINNVPSTFTRSNNDYGNQYYNLGPGKNGLCPNGQGPGVAGAAAGLCALPQAQAGQANNFNIAQTNSNPVTYQGARLAARYEINADWDVLITETLQNLNVEGISAEYPTGSDFQPLAPLQITAFEPSWDKDNWENTSWTVNGKLGPLHAVYTGGYMLRHISQQQDYTNYSRTAAGMYYECTGGSTGWGGPAQCYSPLSYWNDQVRNTHITEEFRLSTPDTWRLRGLAGVYWEQYDIFDNMNFDYKTIPSCNAVNLASALGGGLPCVGTVATAPGSTANDPGARGDATAFGEDTQRGYSQTAFFGSFDFDIIPNVLTVTAGTRWYDYNEFEKGSEYETGTGCLDIPNGACVAPINIDSHNDHVKYTGFKSRAGVTWHPNSLTTVYYLFSQGFRPGAFNRSEGDVADLVKGADPQLNKPNGYAPDSLTNNEIGIKTDLFDRRLRVNLSAYYMDWDNVQFAFFNPTELGNTTFLTNGPNYTVKGVEFQLTGRPMEGLTLEATGSYNDAEQSSSPCLINNVASYTSPAGNSTLGQCITSIYNKALGATVPFTNPYGTNGSPPPFSPKFQGTLRGRYDWTFGAYKAFVTADASYTGSSFNQPATYTPGSSFPNNIIPTTTLLRYEMPAYALFDASIGIKKEHYTVTLFASNIGDSHASMFTSSAQFIKSEVPVRPRTFGVKIDFAY